MKLNFTWSFVSQKNVISYSYKPDSMFGFSGKSGYTETNFKQKDSVNEVQENDRTR